MLYSSVILALATAASAIDIRFWTESHCRKGLSTSCTNVASQACCNGRVSSGYAALSVAAIPTNWDVLSRAYNAEGCNDRDLVQQFRSEGRTDTCHGDNRGYRSGKFFFPGKKMIRGMEVARNAPEDCQPADTLYFADETRYAISDITDAQVEELLEFGKNGTAQDDLPAEYKALKMD